jgi:hypothetical protein
MKRLMLGASAMTLAALFLVTGAQRASAVAISPASAAEATASQKTGMTKVQWGYGGGWHGGPGRYGWRGGWRPGWGWGPWPYAYTGGAYYPTGPYYYGAYPYYYGPGPYYAPSPCCGGPRSYAPPPYEPLK